MMQRDLRDFYNEQMKQAHVPIGVFRIIADLNYNNKPTYHTYIGNEKGSFSIWTIKVYG